MEERWCSELGKWIDEDHHMFEVKPKQTDKKKKEDKGDIIPLHRCDWCGGMVLESLAKVYEDRPQDSPVTDYIITCPDCAKDLDFKSEEGYTEVPFSSVPAYVIGH